MNLVDLKSKFIIQPEDDSILKIVIREAFGVNTQIQLCHPQEHDEPDCFQTGSQIGTTEILYNEHLKRDQPYIVVLDYSHSVLAFHKFDVCPHLPIEISMITTEERRMINAEKENQMGSDRDNKHRLQDIFNRMSGAQKVNLDDPLNEG